MITTQSGTYTIESYKKIENTIKQAYKDLWNNKITIQEHKKLLEKTGFSEGEIRSLQYQASLE